MEIWGDQYLKIVCNVRCKLNRNGKNRRQKKIVKTIFNKKNHLPSHNPCNAFFNRILISDSDARNMSVLFEKKINFRCYNVRTLQLVTYTLIIMGMNATGIRSILHVLDEEWSRMINGYVWLRWLWSYVVRSIYIVRYIYWLRY